jgi:hypothetical protein
MTFNLTPDQFTAKVAQLEEQGVTLIGTSGSVAVPGHPELTIQWSYDGKALIVNVEGGNMFERSVATGEIGKWLRA